MKNYKIFKVWCSHSITLVITNFRPFCSISYRFRDKNFFKKKWQNSQFGLFAKILKIFQIMVLLHIITLVITNFRPFCSISYRFRDKNFFLKNGKIANFANLPKFWKIIKFSKYGALTYYNPCDHQFSSVLLYLLPFPR